jgi:hypothetical protein
MTFYEHANDELALVAEGISLSFGILLCAITLAISARSKRAFAALCTAIGLIVFALAFLPVLLAEVLLPGQSDLYHGLMALNPFHVLAHLDSSAEGYGDSFSVSLTQGWLITALYLLIAFAVLFGTTWCLQGEDGDGHFKYRRNNA